MTQAKGTKKKKAKKESHNEKKTAAVRSKTPVDKKVKAEANIKNMLVEAQKMHKSYLERSTRRMQSAASYRASGKLKDAEKQSINASNENMERRSKLFKMEDLKKQYVSEIKCNPKNSMESSQKSENSKMNRQAEGIFSRRQETETGRRQSYEFPVRGKEVNTPRKGSAEFPRRTKASVPRRKVSAEVSLRRKEDASAKPAESEYSASKRERGHRIKPASEFTIKIKDNVYRKKEESSARLVRDAVRRGVSAELPINMTKDYSPRLCSTENASRTDTARRVSTANYPVTENIKELQRYISDELSRNEIAGINRLRKVGNKSISEEKDMSVFDGRGTRPAFVSLDLIDKMKCHSSISFSRSRKARRKSRKSRDASELRASTATAKVPKCKSRDSAENQTKFESEAKKIASRDVHHEVRQSSSDDRKNVIVTDARRVPSLKRGNANSNSTPQSGDSRTDEALPNARSRRVKAVSKPGRDRLQCPELYYDSYMSANAVKLKNSKTKDSNNSSESDIDQKFLQILEAVTPKQLLRFDIEESSKNQKFKTENASSTPNEISGRHRPKTGKKETATFSSDRNDDDDDRPQVKMEESDMSLRTLLKMQIMPRRESRDELKSSTLKALLEARNPKMRKKMRRDRSVKSKSPEYRISDDNLRELWTKANNCGWNSAGNTEADTSLISLDDLKKVVGDSVERLCKSFKHYLNNPEKENKVATINETKQPVKPHEEVTAKMVENELGKAATNNAHAKEEKRQARKEPSIERPNHPNAPTKQKKEVNESKPKPADQPRTSKEAVEGKQSEPKTIPKILREKDKKAHYEIQTWSIVKRLEKAFQTLGYDLNELGNSDDSSDKKAHTVKRKRLAAGERKEPSGLSNAKDTDAIPLQATLSRTRSHHEKNKSISKRHGRVPVIASEENRAEKYGARSNGSGDRNIESKIIRTVKHAPIRKKIREKDRTRDAYYTTVDYGPRVILHKVKRTEGDADALSEGDLVEDVLLWRRHSSARQEWPLLHSNKGKTRGKKSRIATHLMDEANNDGITSDRTGAEEKDKQAVKRSKRLRRSNLDDINLDVKRHRMSKRKSEHSISITGSFSSLSDDNRLKRYRRRRKNVHDRKRFHRDFKPFSVDASDDELWKINVNGKGDTVANLSQRGYMDIDFSPAEIRQEGETELRPASRQSGRRKSSGKEGDDNGNRRPVTGGKKLILKLEEESNELELKQIRERHKQIISEIRMSLEEIRKQNNLYSKLQLKTKRFNKDCHVKRNLIASYLRDVELNNLKRNAQKKVVQSAKARLKQHLSRLRRRSHRKRTRAFSLESHQYSERKRSKLRNKLSQYDLKIRKPKKKIRDIRRHSRTSDYEVTESVMSLAGTSTGSDLEELEPGMFGLTTTEPLTSYDSFDELLTFRSAGSSTVKSRSRCGCKFMESQENVVCTGSSTTANKLEVLCSKWKHEREDDEFGRSVSSGISIKEAPSYLMGLLEKLNNIIFNEKCQLEDMVVNASAPSERSSHSERARTNPSTHSSGFNSSKQHILVDERSSSDRRPIPACHKSSSTSVTTGGSRPQRTKSKGSRRGSHEKSPEVDGGKTKGKSGTLIRDPGGENAAGSDEPQQEILLPEAFSVGNAEEQDRQQGHLKTSQLNEREVEEYRYRKGDPSYSYQTHLIESVASHSRHHWRRTPEEEAERRKIELERILQRDEKNLRHASYKESTIHSAEYDSAGIHSDRSKHSPYTRHRQKSLIIDLNKADDNEESQTVLGHASRHIGADYCQRKCDRKKIAHEYFLANKRLLESIVPMSLTKLESGKKHGRKHQSEEHSHGSHHRSYSGTECSGIRANDGFKNADCQTDIIDDFEDIDDMYLLDDSNTTHSIVS